jgi:hypothetical protein
MPGGGVGTGHSPTRLVTQRCRNLSSPNRRNEMFKRTPARLRAFRGVSGPACAETAVLGADGEADAVTALVRPGAAAQACRSSASASREFVCPSLGSCADVSRAVRPLDLRHGGADAPLFCALPVVASSAFSVQDTRDTPRADAVAPRCCNGCVWVDSGLAWVPVGPSSANVGAGVHCHGFTGRCELARHYAP